MSPAIVIDEVLQTNNDSKTDSHSIHVDDGVSISSGENEKSEELLRTESDHKFIDELVAQVEALPRIAFSVLSLYSGPENREKGFDKFVETFGGKADTIDVEVNKHRHDMLEILKQGKLVEKVANEEYDSCLIASPCSSFSGARYNKGDEQGPRQLRGEFEPERFGLPDLWPDEQEFVKQGTL